MRRAEGWPISQFALAVTAILIGVDPTSAELFPISDTSYPHVVIMEQTGTPVTWHRKSVAFKLVHSIAVRINSRGIQFIPSSHHLQFSTQHEDMSDMYKANSLSTSHWIWDEWWGNKPTELLTEAEVKSAQNATAPNRWRGIPCIPAR